MIGKTALALALVLRALRASLPPGQVEEHTPSGLRT